MFFKPNFGLNAWRLTINEISGFIEKMHNKASPKWIRLFIKFSKSKKIHWSMKWVNVETLSVTCDKW